MIRTLIALIFLLIPSATVAQQSDTRRAETIRALTGRGEREWVFERVETYMGRQRSCVQGEVFRFRRDGTAVLEKCDRTRRVMRHTTHRWSLIFPNRADVLIRIEGHPEYHLIFRTPEIGMREMVLRERTGLVIDTTKDRIYLYEGP